MTERYESLCWCAKEAAAGGHQLAMSHVPFAEARSANDFIGNTIVPARLQVLV